jgi:hypothetical protein
MDVGNFISKFQSVFKIEKSTATTNTQIIADPKLKQELADAKQQLDEANQAIEEKQKEVDGLEEKNEALLSEIAQLESVKKLRDAILSIIPIQTAIQAPAESKPSGEGKTVSMNLNHTAMQVSIQDAGIETVNFSTKTQKGQMMFCIVNELPNTEEGWSNGDLIDRCLEHGWAINKSTVSVELSKWASQGMLIKTAKGYRLPKFVKFEVEKA